MKRLLIILIALIFNSVAAQEPKQMLPIYFDYIIVPGDASNTCYISYKIPYNQLVFIKGDDNFTSGVSMNFEVEENEKIINRVFDTRQISVVNYEITKSRNEFVEGLINLNLKVGVYKIIPTVELKNTDISMKLPSYELNINRFDSKFIKPFVVEPEKEKCEDNKKFALKNFRGNLNFADLRSALLFPIKDFDEDSVLINIYQKGKNVFSGSAKYLKKNNLILRRCDHKIVIDESEQGVYGFYLLKDFSKRISEGDVEVELKSKNETKKFELKCEWIGRPKSLNNKVLAIKALRIIDEQENFEKLYKEETYDELVEFWKKFDPTPDTEFNELMFEFYTRVDHSVKNFSTIKSFNGAFTDRGETYIKFGSPDKTDRNYNRRNEIIETWEYNNLNRRFIFKDITGTGDFELIN